MYSWQFLQMEHVSVSVNNCEQDKHHVIQCYHLKFAGLLVSHNAHSQMFIIKTHLFKQCYGVIN